MSHLNTEYGSSGEWQKHTDENFELKNLISNGKWTDNQWPNAVRFYNLNGQININRTLEFLNSEIIGKTKIEANRILE